MNLERNILMNPPPHKLLSTLMQNPSVQNNELEINDIKMGSPEAAAADDDLYAAAAHALTEAQHALFAARSAPRIPTIPVEEAEKQATAYKFRITELEEALKQEQNSSTALRNSLASAFRLRDLANATRDAAQQEVANLKRTYEREVADIKGELAFAKSAHVEEAKLLNAKLALSKTREIDLKTAEWDREQAYDEADFHAERIVWSLEQMVGLLKPRQRPPTRRSRVVSNPGKAHAEPFLSNSSAHLSSESVNPPRRARTEDRQVPKTTVESGIKPVLPISGLPIPVLGRFSPSVSPVITAPLPSHDASVSTKRQRGDPHPNEDNATKRHCLDVRSSITEPLDPTALLPWTVPAPTWNDKNDKGQNTNATSEVYRQYPSAEIAPVTIPHRLQTIPIRSRDPQLAASRVFGGGI
ncbi:hypothetical protein R3P38DRAFT_276806 [Favolaschia claudopus]|uniref:Uncharacterized protein n=1 Tax=Favolaschia claudopus TaxID=2862362 RepID=A0AAV9ZR85_9AGAR